MHKRGPQICMTLQQCLCSGLERLRIQRAFQTEHQLHGVNVRHLGIVEGMEQESLLQRRQWQDIFELGVLGLQLLDLGLRERHQRKVRRGVAPRAGLCGVTNQGL